MGSNPYVFGLALIAVGVAFWLLTRLALRSAQSAKPTREQALEPAKTTLSQHQEAMIVIQKGGRVAQINPRARELFHLEAHDFPDLEALARRVRPGEEFLTL